MSIAAADPCTVDSAEGDCPSAGSEPILSDSRTGQTLESYIHGDDCGWVACSSNNHQSSIILRQFSCGYAGTYYHHLDALGSPFVLSARRRNRAPQARSTRYKGCRRLRPKASGLKPSFSLASLDSVRNNCPQRSTMTKRR